MSRISRAANRLFTLESPRSTEPKQTLEAEPRPIQEPFDSYEYRLRALEQKRYTHRSHGFVKTVGVLGLGAAMGVGGILGYGMLNKTTVVVEEMSEVAEVFATGEAHIGTIGTNMHLEVHVNRKTPIIDVKPDYDASLDVHTQVDLALPTIMNNSILDIKKITTKKRGQEDDVRVTAKVDASQLILRGNRVSFEKSGATPYDDKDPNSTKVINWLALDDRVGRHTNLQTAALAYAEKAAADPMCVKKALAQVAVNKGFDAQASSSDQVNAGVELLLKNAIINSILKDQGSLIDPSHITVDVNGIWKTDGINGQLGDVLDKYDLKSGAIQRGDDRCNTAQVLFRDGHSFGPLAPLNSPAAYTESTTGAK